MKSNYRVFLLHPAIFLALMLLHSPLHAQIVFDSGSAGSGPLELRNGTCPPTTHIDVSANGGIMEYTFIFIDSSCTVTFSPRGNGFNRVSAPVRLLASGDVTILGTINLDGLPGQAGIASTQVLGGIGGPGGYDGGHSAPPTRVDGWKGFGPGGGHGGIDGLNFGRGTGGVFTPAASSGAEQPLVGGSGGGGGSDDPVVLESPGAGGGGGGALLIASSGTILHDGTISARGGNGAVSNGISNNANGGAGSGGMVHLIANAIAGAGTIDLAGGSAPHVVSLGGTGVLVREATDDTSMFTVTGTSLVTMLAQAVLDFSAEPYIFIVDIDGVTPVGGVITLATITTATVTVSISPELVDVGKSFFIRSVGEHRTGDSTASIPINATIKTATITIYPGTSLLSVWVE